MNRCPKIFLLLTVLVAGLAAVADAARVTDLRAVHRAGQTFLTWREPNAAITNDVISFPAFRAVAAQVREPAVAMRYRIYRSDRPIHTTEGLKPVGEAEALSCWNGAFMGYGDAKETDRVARYAIADGQPPLAPGTGLYVHNPQGTGVLRGYYAVTVVASSVEDATLDAGNALPEAVAETLGQGTPVLQSVKTVDSFTFVDGPTLRHYVRWEAPPHANRENQPNDILVGIPKNLAKPAPVGLHLHCWGGNPYSGYGWWYNAEKGAILIAANQVPYDWWTGYHELQGKVPRERNAWAQGVVHPYTQRRVLALVDWAATQWEIDRSRTFVGGSSMGGSGSVMLAIRHPQQIAWAIGWVGVHIPQQSPTFKNSYADVYGDPEWGIQFEDGTPVWNYFNDAWYLRQHPERETPFITWSNGKNDGAIGWAQAVEFYRAMQETRHPHLFNWGQAGHAQRAVMPRTLEQRIMPIDIRIDQSLPAFTRCSLDNRPGSGDPADGDPEGGVNLYLFWETTDIVDEPGAWEMTVGLTPAAPQDTCTVDLTARRLQHFKLQPGDTVKWTNTSAGRVVQSGTATADQYGLLTLPELAVHKTGNRIRIAKK